MTRVPLACALLLVAAPAASAQGFEFTLDVIEGPDTPIEPITGSAKMQVPWMVDCSGPISTASRPTGTISWSVAAPQGVRVTGSTEEPIVLPSCHEVRSMEGVSEFYVAVDHTVPAMQDVEVVMTSTLRWDEVHPLGHNSSTDSSVHEVQADYRGILGVEAPERIVRAPPGGASTIVLFVTNLGNGATIARFSVEDPTHPGTLVLPDPLALEPGATGAAVLYYEHPSASHDVTALVRATPHFAGDEDLTDDSAEIPVLFTDRQGVTTAPVHGTEAPASSGLVFLIVVLGVAVARSTRHGTK